MTFLLPMVQAVQQAEPNSPKPLPRTIVALYDAESEERPRFSLTHRFLEMPLNHLGFEVRYYNINGQLPELGDDVYGVVWFLLGSRVRNPEVFLKWASDVVDKGKKVIVFGYVGAEDDFRSKPEGMKQVNHFLNKIGVHDHNVWVSVTYQAKIHYKNRDLVDFERALDDVIPQFMDTKKIGSDAVSHFQVIRKDDQDEQISDLIVTSPRGGYVAPDFGAYYDYPKDIRLWLLNPFGFLDLALQSKDFPRPDTTTLAGNRIFYAHIDGDAWNNITELKKYGRKHPISAYVVQKEIIEKYPDFPFSVGVIVAELLTDCYGLPESEKVARDLMALPNVEPTSHTHSHPYFWKFFRDNNALKELPLLKRYPTKPSEQGKGFFSIWFNKHKAPEWSKETIEALKKQKPVSYETAWERDDSREGFGQEGVDDVLKRHYGTPRAYACSPFNLDQEIKGSIDYINNISPPDKKVKLIQWPGDTSPFEVALRKTREAGVRNINGGDTRYDPEYPSYAWVAPNGIRVGEEQQIFSSNSNENTYTKLWQGRYYGYRYLQNTVQNTENPRRVKPFNIYFHMFSGEKEASLNAVTENLEFARKQEVIPIYASHYAAIADGFYTVRFIPMGEERWKVESRDELQTIRFDTASAKGVDFSRSEGVLGYRWLQGSLYVALDPAHPAPILALKKLAEIGAYPSEAVPYLIKSRWPLKGLKYDANSLSFQTEGFGNSDIHFRIPQGWKDRKNYEVFVNGQLLAVQNGEEYVNKDGELVINISQATGYKPNQHLEVVVTSK